MWNKYTKNETIKIIGSCGKCKTIYRNGSYLLLTKKRNENGNTI